MIFPPGLSDIAAAAENSKFELSIFDTGGRLLLVSRGWISAAGAADFIGARWLEMLATPEEEAKARAWIASPHDGASVVLLFSAGIPVGGCLLRSAMVKRRVGAYWIAIGASRLEIDEALPEAGPTMALLVQQTLSWPRRPGAASEPGRRARWRPPSR